MFKDKLNYKLLNVLILAIIIYLALITSNYWLVVVQKITSVALPFIIAFAIAYSFLQAVCAYSIFFIQKILFLRL